MIGYFIWSLLVVGGVVAWITLFIWAIETERFVIGAVIFVVGAAFGLACLFTFIDDEPSVTIEIPAEAPR